MIKPLLVILTLTNLVVILLLIWQFEYVDLKQDPYHTDSKDDFLKFEMKKSPIDQEIAKELIPGLNCSQEGLFSIERSLTISFLESQKPEYPPKLEKLEVYSPSLDFYTPDIEKAAGSASACECVDKKGNLKWHIIQSSMDLSTQTDGIFTFVLYYWTFTLPSVRSIELWLETL